MKITNKYVFFYKDWLSNYQETDFDYPSHELPIFNFTSSEQGFMYFKALYFGDYTKADEIYNTLHNPGLCRKLGRQVSGYSDDVWSNIRYQLFEDLVYQKFLQDKTLQSKLLAPEFDGKLFVEASPIDKIWGIGMSEDNPDILDPSKWNGLNYLGKIITNTRNKLWKLINMETNKWIEDLIWCPSQIYYYFQDNNEQKWCIYLRWRHYDPWTSELIPCEDDWEFGKYTTWETIQTSKYYTENEYKELESETLELIKQKFPDTKFPD